MERKWLLKERERETRNCIGIMKQAFFLKDRIKVGDKNKSLLHFVFKYQANKGGEKINH